LAADGVTPEQVAGFFRAAARLYRAAPWTRIASDEDLLAVDIETWSVRGRVVSIIGGLGEATGFIVFQNRADFERFLAETEHARRTGAPPELPAYLSLNFKPVADVPAALRREAAKHGWELGGQGAFPIVLAARGLVADPPSPQQLALLEALANAIAELISADAGALADERGLDRTLGVTANGQHVPVRLSMMAPPRPTAPVPGTFDPRAEQRDDDGMIDEDWAVEFEGELLARFAASAEASGLPDAGWTGMVLEYGRNHLGAMVGRIGAADLRELLFEIVPRKVSCEPECAAAIVTELRAFWTWAQREFQLETAEECLAVLRPGAEITLRRELANPANFGMAKSMVMAGIAAGYDLSTRDGLDRWMGDVNAGRVPLPDLPALDGLRFFGSPERRGHRIRKKKKRKAQRAARKRKR
jgi:hypothetical protein